MLNCNKSFKLSILISLLSISSYGQQWSLSGNTIVSGDFLGSTNNEPIEFRVNNQVNAILNSSSRLGLGISPNTSLHIKSPLTEGTAIGVTSLPGGGTVQTYTGTNVPVARVLLQHTNTGNSLFDGLELTLKETEAYLTNHAGDIRITPEEELSVSGNVGIHTLNPQSPLHLVGGASALQIETDMGLPAAEQYTDIIFTDQAVPNSKRNWLIRSSGPNSGNPYQLTFWSPETSAPKIYYAGTGLKMGIGTNNFVGDHMLYVRGKIICEELTVKLHDEWADFVFADNYNLMSLSDVEAYIQKNRHLPDVPSAEEIEANGVQSGKMDAILLQKIEELTLYIIELEKKLNNLK